MTWFLIVAGHIVAWITGPIIVLHYRWKTIPLRFEEILARFCSTNSGETLAPSDVRSKTGAWHYARLLSPDSDPQNPEEIISRQFWRHHGWDRYYVPLGLMIAVSGIMLAFSCTWVLARLSESAPASRVVNQAISSNVDKSVSAEGEAGVEDQQVRNRQKILQSVPTAIVMALWGAYVWSLFEILRRRASGNLTPLELYDVVFRFLTAVPIGYAFSLLVFDQVTPLAAFAVSAFPLRDIQQYFRKISLKKLDEKPSTIVPNSCKGNLSETLCGLGNDTITRLEELNIETYLDLAYSDPIKLLIKTGVSIELVLSWIDQAMVSVYATPYKSTLTAYGLPCALDLCEFFAEHCWDVSNDQFKPNWQTDSAVVLLAAKLDLPKEFLVQHMLKSIFEDPYTQFLIRVWFGPAQNRTDI